MVGKAWLALGSELEQELRESDPSAEVRAGIDASGLVRYEVAGDRSHRVLAHAARRRYEERANRICEHCGGEVATVGAGPVVTVVCPGCL